MKTYNVDEVFKILKAKKITAHEESVRRWLRQGIIKGIAPSSRKEGWKIPEKALDDFIQQRLPSTSTTEVIKESEQFYTTNDVKEVEERTRKTIWFELANKNIWEGFIEIKKTRLRECIQHKRYSKELEEAVWQACVENSSAYSKPRVFYLLDAFRFDQKRLLLDKKFSDIEEQILFPIIEHIRLKRVKRENTKKHRKIQE